MLYYFKLIMNIKKITYELIEKFSNEIKEKENLEKLKLNVLDPCITYILEKLYPYLIITTIIFVLTLFIAIIILTILLRQKI